MRQYFCLVCYWHACAADLRAGTTKMTDLCCRKKESLLNGVRAVNSYWQSSYYGTTSAASIQVPRPVPGNAVVLATTLSPNSAHSSRKHGHLMAFFHWHIESYRKGGAAVQSDCVWRRNSFAVRQDLVATGFGNLPAWCHGDPALLFAASDAYERKNGAACRHLVVYLPRELSLAEQIRLVEALIVRDIGPKPYQYGIHHPVGETEENPHVHILYSDRTPDGIQRSPEEFFSRANPQRPELGGCKKDSGGKSKKQVTLDVISRKKLWANLQNEALERAGCSARVEYQPDPGKSRRR